MWNPVIEVNVIRKDGEYQKICYHGHAGFALEGEDIVCAAVSALTINTFNSIEAFTQDDVACELTPEGQIRFWEFTGEVSKESRLLMDSLLLGLKQIRDTYGEEFLRVEDEKM